MQAVELTIPKLNVARVSANPASGNIGDWLIRLFGCRHRDMSRPFSHQGHAYRSCLNCGAQRQFNLGNWKMQGDYYYPVESRPQLAATNLASFRTATN